MFVLLNIILSLLGSASAIWCAPNKEVTKLDQMKALGDAFIRCHIMGKNESTTDTDCNTIFDGLMCWPRTKAGTVSILPCPGYIHGFDTEGYATKECLHTGDWQQHPTRNTSYTNFTGCIPTKTLPVKHEPTIVELMGDHMTSIQTLYRVGYAFSLVCLVVAVLIMIIFSKLRCQRNTVHINLFISFIFRCIICIIKDEYSIPEDETGRMEEVIQQITSNQSWWCKFIHALFFYFLVANYTWIFVEGIYLHTLIFVTTFHNISGKMFKVMIIVGWISPLLCVLPWIAVRSIYENTLCWNLHNEDNGFIWIIQGPIIATLVINCGFFLNIIRVLFTKLSAANTRDPKRYRKLAKSTLVLIPLFGVHYIVVSAIPICLDPTMAIARMYTELFLSSFQGFIVSLLFCFLNDEVQNEIRKHWKWHRLRRQSLVSSRSTRTFSIQSSGSGKEQECSEKYQNGFSAMKETDSSNSLFKENVTNPTTETVLSTKEISTVDSESSLKENENVPFLSSQKVSFV